MHTSVLIPNKEQSDMPTVKGVHIVQKLSSLANYLELLNGSLQCTVNLCLNLVLWTCSKGTFSHSVQISDSNHAHSLANFFSQGSQPANTCPELKLLAVPEMELLQGDGSAFYTFLVQREREKWLIQYKQMLFYSQPQQQPCALFTHLPLLHSFW